MKHEIKYLIFLNWHNKHTHTNSSGSLWQVKGLLLIMTLVLEITGTQLHQSWNYTQTIREKRAAGG